MKRSRRLATLVAAILTIAAGTATAATVGVATGLLAIFTKTITHTSCTVTGASTDITIDEAHPTVTTNTSQLTVLATAGSLKWSLIKFSLSSCSNIGDAAVDSATLNIYVNSAINTGGTHLLKAYEIDTSTANNWSATTNWNTKPSKAASASSSVTPATGQWVAFDVSNDVNDMIQTSPTILPPYTATANNNGWVIDDEGTSTVAVTMNATESTTNKPYLTVNYAY